MKLFHFKYNSNQVVQREMREGLEKNVYKKFNAHQDEFLKNEKRKLLLSRRQNAKNFDKVEIIQILRETNKNKILRKKKLK